MNLEKLLNAHGRSVADITKIYHGRENCCRCGCGGNYFERGDRGFTRVLNAIAKPDFKPLNKGDIMHTNYGEVKCAGIMVGDNAYYVDIPYNPDNDKCYCLYFD